MSPTTTTEKKHKFIYFNFMCTGVRHAHMSVWGSQITGTCWVTDSCELPCWVLEIETVSVLWKRCHLSSISNFFFECPSSHPSLLCKTGIGILSIASLHQGFPSYLCTGYLVAPKVGALAFSLITHEISKITSKKKNNNYLTSTLIHITVLP